VGLVQRAIEAEGIATVGITLVREFTEQVLAPRTVHLKWPFGHPLGEPDNRKQQRAVLRRAFQALYAIDKPGTIVDLPFKWRRHSYSEEDRKMLELKKQLCSDSGMRSSQAF
jgi:hypothetical protein